MSRSVAQVDLDAVAHNVRTMAAAAEPATLCVVVKADGYGHGAVAVAEAAIAAGVRWLAVAQVDEARELRAAGIDASVLVLAEPAPHELESVVALGVRQVVYRAETIDALAETARRFTAPPLPVHLKVDTGMRRAGCEPDEALARAEAIVASPALTLEGTMTHCAVADEPGNPTTDEQLDRFDAVLDTLARAGIDPGIRHAANSAATLTSWRARYDLVRVGIAAYGLPPSPALAGAVELRPALRWVSTVSHAKQVPAGEAVSYGHAYRLPAPANLATVPVGYADGYRRALGLAGGHVLIRGRRCPVRGVVTMDQLVVEVDGDVSVGDEVVLIGAQGDEEVTADELAGLLGTINYEITCGLSPRVAWHPRGGGV